MEDNVSVTLNEDVYIAVCNVVDNTIQEGDGSTVGEDGYWVSPALDDGDRMIEVLRKQGDTWTWEANINSKCIGDGTATLHYLVFDEAGNIASKTVDIFIANNRPRIAGMKFATDDNANGTYEERETIKLYSAVAEGGTRNKNQAASSLMFPDDFDQANPVALSTVRNKMQVIPEIVGGNGALYREIKVYGHTYGSGENPAITEWWNVLSGQSSRQALSMNGRTDDVVQDVNINLTVADMKGYGIADGDYKKFIVTVSDSTPGQSLSADLSVILNFKLDDTEKPDIRIRPFYWNSSSINSLYEGKVSNGHIELSKDLPSGKFNQTEGEYDKDPKVSGKIVLEGIAHDNAMLGSIILNIGGVEKTITSYSGDWIPATDLPTGVSGVKTEQATFDELKASGIFPDCPTGTDKVPFNSQEYGHVVKWSAVLDTASAFGAVAATDKTIIAKAKDRGSPNESGTYSNPLPSETSDAQTGGTDGAAAYTNRYRMDAVPYITKIGTRLDSAYSANTSVFNRSATGAYPVMRGETGFKLYGFNLNGASTTVKFNGTSVGTVTAGTTSDYVTFKVPATAKSGEIEVTVGTVSSLNNKNSETAEYNLEPNNINNNILNDNRRVYVWGMNDVLSGVKTVRYPTFRIGKNSNQTYAFVYDHDGKTVRYFKEGNTNVTILDSSFSQWYATACAVDSAGHIYASAQNGDSGGSGNISYNGYYPNYKFYALADTQSGTSYTSTEGAYSQGGNNVALESCIASDGNFYAERIQNPKIATLGSNATKMYTVYYDSALSRLVFRYGEASNGVTFSTASGNGIVGLSKYYKTSSANARVIDDSANVGEYAAVGVIPTGVTGAGTAVVCWNTDNKLKFKYNTNPANNTWSSEITIDSDYAGEYCDLAVDAAGGIHIAYYRAGNKLKYAYLSSYTDTVADVCMVDSYLSVGENISIETSSKTISYTEGETTKTRYVPYISYYSNAIGMAKVAWPVKLGTNNSATNTFVDGVANDQFTGTWEVQALPTSINTKLLNYTIGVGEKSNGTANSVMLGYGTKTGLQTALLY